MWLKFLTMSVLSEETDELFTSKNRLKNDLPMHAREISSKLRQFIVGCCSSEIKTPEYCGLNVLLTTPVTFAGIDSEDLIGALKCRFERQIIDLA